ncbi:SIMPL domain-containing protein [Nitrosopumilus sp. K4]|uniref:SIMPL domain-containing protein n=1 Tax=Nitrosopumilus sp. K4 TaxID=2795383 RepID=UPI001BA937EC|nr:SIMPL domain-containing protein [Nitrosopumilus sp. K4]QUC64028.1 SIMPL domain-containing protein [Nitrosopumilus sp. K4]
MNKQVTLPAIAGLILVFAFAVNLTLAENQAEAETTPFPSREKVISVTGTATASVEPDLLVVTFGMETQEKTAKEALSKNSASMNSVVDAITSLGISSDELSTSRLSIYPVYDNYRDPQTERYTQELVGYRVTNTLTVETTQLGKAADIIDNAVSSGANRVDNVAFTLSPQKQIDVKDDLLGKAVINAKKKAENALAPLNHKIIGVKAVTLSEFGMPPPIPMYATAIAEDASFKSSTPVFSSDQDISTTASVIFLIGSN